MEQTINTFNEGMIMDLNPLTTPNNVLTSCLNGTFITYDGNEFVLQNDNGNGRVETAYLPSGYVPVGIKEYGGIIYVASYNPLTNKSQIGSFPSPERNISSEETGNPGLSIKTEDFFDGNLKTTYVKLDLFDENDNILRPGDKFGIQFYSNATWSELRNLITSFDNNKTTKLLTLRLAVLDNNGNLRDITNQLKRVDENGNPSDDGFWMQKLTDSPVSDGNLSGSGIDEIRNSKNVLNIYNNKLSGKLYIIAELNTINSYELSVTGVKNDTSEILNWAIKTSDKNGDEKILKTVSIPSKKAAVHIQGTYTSDYPENEKDYWLGVMSSLKEDSNSIIKYIKGRDPDIRRNDIIINDINITSMFGYEVTPAMEFGLLPAFKRSGMLDIALLGTGKITLSEWRYYNDITSNILTLNWGLQAYLRDDQEIKSIEFVFYDLDEKFSTPKVIQAKSRRSYNGSFVESISYGNEIQSGKLYLVNIKVILNESEVNYYRWIFTTSLFNEDYYTGESDFKNLNMRAIEIGGSNNLELVGKTPNSKVKSGDLHYLNENPTTPTNPVPFGLSNNTETVFKYSIKPSYTIKEQSQYPFNLEESQVDYSFEVDKGTVSITGVDLQTVGLGSDKAKEAMNVTESKESDDANNYTIIEDDRLWIKYSEVVNNEFSITLNAVAQFKAEAKESDISNKSMKLFKKYGDPDTLKGAFRYDTSSGVVEYDFSCGFHRKNRKGRGNYYLHSGNTAIVKKEDIVDRGVHPWSVIRGYFEEICKSAMGGVPNIMVWSGKPTNLKRTRLFPENGDFHTNEYNLIIWKTAPPQSEWVILNIYCNNPNGQNGVQVITDKMNKVYVCQDETFSGKLYSAGNGVYNSSYTFQNVGNLKTKFTLKDKEKAFTLANGDFYNETTIENYINSKFGVQAAEILEDAGTTNVLVTDITSSDVPSVLEQTVSCPNIVNNLIPFQNVETTLPSIGLQDGNKLLTSDSRGEALNEKTIYYVQNGTIYKAKEANPNSHPTEYQIGSYFQVEYDSYSQRNQLYIIKGISPVLAGNQEYPYLGTNGRGFHFMSKSERCFLNIDLGANKLRK